MHTVCSNTIACKSNFYHGKIAAERRRAFNNLSDNNLNRNADFKRILKTDKIYTAGTKSETEF